MRVEALARPACGRADGRAHATRWMRPRSGRSGRRRAFAARRSRRRELVSRPPFPDDVAGRLQHCRKLQLAILDAVGDAVELVRELAERRDAFSRVEPQLRLAGGIAAHAHRRLRHRTHDHAAGTGRSQGQSRWLRGRSQSRAACVSSSRARVCGHGDQRRRDRGDGKRRRQSAAGSVFLGERCLGGSQSRESLYFLRY